MTNYYSAKLRQEYQLVQVLAQTGLPEGAHNDNLVALGYYPVVEIPPSDRVFFDPPVQYQVCEDEGVCNCTLTTPVSDLVVVKERAFEYVWESGRKDCLDELGKEGAKKEAILFSLLGFPSLSGKEERIRDKVDHWKYILERVKLAKSVDDIREILIENELLNVPTYSR